MIQVECSSKLPEHAKLLTEKIVQGILDRCDPYRLINEGIGINPPKWITNQQPTHVLAFGKASVAMTNACMELLGSRFNGGVVLCPEQLKNQLRPIPNLQALSVDHPNPTQRNIQATAALVEYAKSIPQPHACIVCISGGGSAHLCSPQHGVTLDQIIETTRAFNKQGRTIHELNQARRELETLKAGGLAKHLTHIAHVETLVLSDVIDDDLDTIASGPMRDPDQRVPHTIIANHRTALLATRTTLKAQGFKIGHASGDVQGEATDCGTNLAIEFVKNPVAASIMAGETTVDTKNASGLGGPCMETALACAIKLVELGTDGWLVLGLATDGIDGPTDAAGAVITSEMMQSVDIAHAKQSLINHDSLAFLQQLNALILTGPTGTNLNDVCMVLPYEMKAD